MKRHEQASTTLAFCLTAQWLPRMAKHFITQLVAVSTIVVSSVGWAAPEAPVRTSASEPLRIPVIVKKIFPLKPDKTNASDTKPSGEKPDDILRLGISKQGTTRTAKSSSPAVAVATSTAALIFVIGIFLLIAWFMKRGASRARRSLPTEAFEILGRSSLSPSQAVQLVRIGNKLLLLASSTDDVTTLTEIVDADEVSRLSGLCMQHQGTSATKEFHETLEELAVGSSDSDADLYATSAPALLDQTPADIDSVSFSDASLLIPAK